jgi:hypothetical protein
VSPVQGVRRMVALDESNAFQDVVECSPHVPGRIRGGSVEPPSRRSAIIADTMAEVTGIFCRIELGDASDAERLSFPSAKGSSL